MPINRKRGSAYYLSEVEELSYLGERSAQSGGYSPTEVNNIAIEQLKLEVVNRGGNGYLVESCKDFTSDYQDCDVATLCSGKAYSFSGLTLAVKSFQQHYPLVLTYSLG
ncbi:hypothetical protein AN394_01154 [Pseudoalteromonas sp. P1-26]|uniref:hypothetical protein n=1 Tax=Pseudoalteromonas sp. P1-26 TaxID=1723759 RepID=UPI0006D66EBC|nr:hypothetical protein [Pseudoalteromonas sp. P1-26]KPZ73907.1 hypothetical protein AN394_01154 [Pseudoalteromonas sp. P1-26]